VFTHHVTDCPLPLHHQSISLALLTRLTAVNFDTDSTPMRVLIKADWSDNNSTLAWKTPNDIRSFHLQVSETTSARREKRSPVWILSSCRTLSITMICD
jgi:hypothetical protein